MASTLPLCWATVVPPPFTALPYTPVGVDSGPLRIVPDSTEFGARSNTSPAATALAVEPSGPVTASPAVCAAVARPSTEAPLVLTTAGRASGRLAAVPARVPATPLVVFLPLLVTSWPVQEDEWEVPPTASAVPPTPTGAADRWSAMVPAMVPPAPLVVMSPPPVAAWVAVPLVEALLATATALLANCTGVRFCERTTLPASVCPAPSVVTGVGALYCWPKLPLALAGEPMPTWLLTACTGAPTSATVLVPARAWVRAFTLSGAPGRT